MIRSRARATASPASDAQEQPPAAVRSGNLHVYLQGVLQQPRLQLKKQVVQIAPWNVGSMTGRGRELVDVMTRRVAIACVQKTKWKGNCAKNLGCSYKLFYTEECTFRNGVGVTPNEEYSKRVTKVERYSDRLIKVQVVCNGKIWNIIAAYAPQIGRPQEEKEAFLEELGGVIERVLAGEKKVIG